MPGLGDKIKALGQDPRAAQGAEWYKKAETGIWRALDPLGKGVNRLANRAGAESFWPTELAEGEIEKAARILRSFSDGAQADDDGDLSGGVADPKGKGKKDKRHQKVVKKIPPKALQGACGIVIMTLFRTGFGVSGASGSGVVVARLPDGSWSPPSGLLVHTIGFGWLIGLDVYDVVLILRKPGALEEFMKPKVSLGVEFSVAAGPVGNGAMLEGGPNGAACWSYTKSKGAYVGLQLDGSVILKRDDANARFYGGSYSVRDILQGRAMANAAAVRPLLATLYAAEGRPQIMGTQYVPQGPAPGDTMITDQEKAALQQQAQAQEQHGASNPYAAGAPVHSQSGMQYAPPSHAPDGLPYAAGGAAAGAAGAAYAAASQGAHGSNPYAAESASHTSANLPPGYQGSAATPALQDQKTGSTGRRLPPPAPSATTAAAGAALNKPASSSVPQDAPPGYDAPPYDAPPAHSSDAATAPLVPNASDEKEQLRRKYAAEDAAASAGATDRSAESAAPPAAAGGAAANLPAQVTALFDFEGAEPGDLSFAAGDVIDVKNAESDGWWTGSVLGKPGSGIFPVNYTKPL